MKKASLFSVVSALALYLLLGLVGFGDAAGKGKPPPPQPTPSNPGIAFIANGSIYVVDEDGTNRRLVLQSSKNIQYGEPSWSPSGNDLVFGIRSSDRLVAPGVYTIAKVLDTNGNWTGTWSSPLRVAHRASSGFGRPAWRPNDDLIAYEDGNDIFIVQANGSSAPVNLTNSSGILTYFTWSPDGNAFAVMEWHTDISDIVVFQYNGSTNPPTQIASLIREPSSPIASDCKALSPQECLRVFGVSWSKTEPGLIAAAVNTRVSEWVYDIWCINVASPLDVQNLSSSNNDSIKQRPTWSSDDNQLAFADRETRGIATMTLSYTNGTNSCPTREGNQQTLVPSSGSKEVLESPDWRR